ncbi:MAG: acyl-CoA synthetase [Solirubrobacterales bacterium]
MNFISDVVERYPASRPAIVAIDAAGDRRVWHFGELSALAAGVSGAFAARGVRRGDVVMTVMGSQIEWVVSMLACFRMGAVVLPCNLQLQPAELRARAEAAGAVLAVGAGEAVGAGPAGSMSMTVGEVRQAMDEDRPQEPPAEVIDLAPEDPALVIFSSGTTGEPKGIVHAQRYLTGQQLQAEHWLGARDGDLVWCTAAAGWSKSARNAFVAPWLQGAVALVHDARFDPQARLELCEREGVNVLCQSPTEYRMLASRSRLRPVASLRRLVAAGEALEADVIATFRDVLGLTIADGYGQSETGHVTAPPAGRDPRPGSMGRPLPGIETRITEGELEIRASSTPTFFSHYVSGERFDERWWPTGDLVREDDDGYLWHEGRADDVIISSGYRIGPVEVESALLTHPAVAEAAAVPAPDAERGSVVKAVVVLTGTQPSEALAQELQDHVRERTAPYKYPRTVEFVAELPKTVSGKIKRRELR